MHAATARRPRPKPILKATILAIGIVPAVVAIDPAIASRHKPPPVREVGHYILSDDSDTLLQTGGGRLEIHRQLAGGGLLYSDCIFTGSVIGAVRTTPEYAPEALSVFKLTPDYWVNDPDPAEHSDLVARWPVPESLEGIPRLLLCYEMTPISGELPPGSEDGRFCDWAPRDLRQPFIVSIEDETEVTEMLLSVELRGRRPLLCSDVPD